MKYYSKLYIVIQNRVTYFGVKQYIVIQKDTFWTCFVGGSYIRNQNPSLTHPIWAHPTVNIQYWMPGGMNPVYEVGPTAKQSNLIWTQMGNVFVFLVKLRYKTLKKIRVLYLSCRSNAPGHTPEFASGSPHSSPFQSICVKSTAIVLGEEEKGGAVATHLLWPPCLPFRQRKMPFRLIPDRPRTLLSLCRY